MSSSKQNAIITPFVESMASAESLSDVEDSLEGFCEEYGLEHFIYGSLTAISLVRPEVIVISGYPEEWRKHYEENNYLAVDPTVEYCREKLVPITWEEITRHGDDRHECLDIARDFGLKDGISVPVHSVGSQWGMISVACEKFENEKTSKIVSEQLNLLAPHVHEAVRRNILKERAEQEGKAVVLTSREKEVLLWSSEGKTTSEVAIILSITERTVTFHLQNTLKKLNVTNRTHAVARAISLGLINPIL